MSGILLRVVLGLAGALAGWVITWWLTTGVHVLSGSDNTVPGVALVLLGLFAGMAGAARVRAGSRDES
jgi:hypothetical protein